MKQIIISLDDKGVVNTEWVGDLNTAEVAWMLAATQTEVTLRMIEGFYERRLNDPEMHMQPPDAGQDSRPAESSVQSDEGPDQS